MAESGPGSDTRSKADFRSAIRIYNELILGSPMNPYYYLQRGSAYQTIGEADRAILDFSDAIRLAPRETYPLINRAIILYARKDNTEGAIADLNAALKLKPCEVSAWANRGIVYKKKGEIDRALADFTASLKCLPPRIDPIYSVVARDGVLNQLSPQQLEHNRVAELAIFTYFQRGLAYYDKSDYDKAIADFSEAIRLNPLNASPYVGRGASYMSKQEYKKAIADFDEALKLSPGQAFAHMQRGIAYHQTGDADKALEDYSAAHDLTPKDPTPLINRGIIQYTKKGKFDAAIADFDESLRLNPKEINALINRGITYRQKNDPDAAITDFNKAIDLGLQTASLLKLVAKDRDPSTAQLADQVAHAYYQRGMASIDKQDYPAALEDFGRAMEITPKDARPYLGRGAALLKQNRTEEAIKDFDEAVRLSPGLASVLFRAGDGLPSGRRLQHAIADYSKSIKLDPKEPLAYINRGMAEIFINKIDEAIEDFDTALELAPDNVNALIQRGFAYGLKKDYAQAFSTSTRRSSSRRTIRPRSSIAPRSRLSRQRRTRPGGLQRRPAARPAQSPRLRGAGDGVHGVGRRRQCDRRLERGDQAQAPGRQPVPQSRHRLLQSRRVCTRCRRLQRGAEDRSEVGAGFQQPLPDQGSPGTGSSVGRA